MFFVVNAKVLDSNGTVLQSFDSQSETMGDSNNQPGRIAVGSASNKGGIRTSDNLIIYWSGFEATWKILAAVFLGRIIFEIALHRSGDVRREDIDWRAASWIWPWLIGLTLIGLIGRYGAGAEILLPDWVDLAVIIVFSLVIFYYAVGVAMSPDAVHDAVETEEDQIASAPQITTA